MKWQRRGRIENDAFALSRSYNCQHFVAFLCLFLASPNSEGNRILLILVGIEKPEGKKLGAERVLVIWLADPAVLTRSGSVSRSKDWLMAALNIF